MKLTVNCKRCNAILEDDDCYDISITDTHIYLYKVGHCPDCETSHQWEEVYEISGIAECKAIEEF